MAKTQQQQQEHDGGECLIASEPFTLSPAAAKFRDQINADWNAARRRRVSHADRRESLDAIDLEKFDQSHIDLGAKLLAEEIGILQSELGIYRRARIWAPTVLAERVKAADAAEAAATAAVGEAVKKLVAMGFEDPAQTFREDDPRSMGLVIFANVHPRVRELAGLAVTIRASTNSPAPTFEHEAAAVERQLRALTRRPEPVKREVPVDASREIGLVDAVAR